MTVCGAKSMTVCGAKSMIVCAAKSMTVCDSWVLLQSQTDAQPEDMHIIGHSLGSHVAGYAGERLRYLGRITGNTQNQKSLTLRKDFTNRQSTIPSCKGSQITLNIAKD